MECGKRNGAGDKVRTERASCSRSRSELSRLLFPGVVSVDSIHEACLIHAIHTNPGVSNKTHSACRRAVELSQLARLLTKSSDGRVRFEMQGAGAQCSLQPGHHGASLGKGTLKCGVVEVILRGFFIAHVMRG